MNLAKLNHILIPTTKDERDQLRDHWLAKRLAQPFAKTYLALSDEGRVLLLFTGVMGVASIDLGNSQNYLLWSILCGLLIASLAVRPLFAIPDLELQVSSPRQVAVDQEMELRLTLSNRGSRDVSSLRVERPFLPWDGKWLGPAPTLGELARGERKSLQTHARFSARGRHHLDIFHVGPLVPLGLCVGQGPRSQGVLFTVVPRIAPVRALDLQGDGTIRGDAPARVRRRGDDPELVGLRPYRVGDRIRDLHAKSWGRLGIPVVREYENETLPKLGLILDCAREDADAELLELTISLGAGIAAHLLEKGLLIDFSLHADRLKALHAGRGHASLDEILEHLAHATVAERFSDDALLEALGPRLGRVDDVLFVSSEWDEQREALLAEVERRGVRCTAVLVHKDRTGPSRSGLKEICADHIRRALDCGEGLVL